MKISYRLFILALFAILLTFSVVNASADEDEDDFEAAPASSSQKPASYVPPAPVPPRRNLMADIAAGDFRRLSKLKLSDFMHEILVFGCFSLYFFFFNRGTAKNKEVAEEWSKITKDVWTKNFAHIGEKNKMELIKDSPRDYIFYASGRVNLKYLYGFLKLATRQDIFSSIMGALFTNSDTYDRISFNITLNENDSDNFVFYTCQKHKLKEFMESRWDVTTFAKLRDVPGFPNKHYAVLTDAPEFANALVNEPRIAKALWASVGLNEKGEGNVLAKSLIESIELSDMPKIKPTNADDLRYPVKRFVINFTLPRMDKLTDVDRQRIVQMTELVIDLVDAVAQFGRLSADGASKVKKLRKEAIEQLVKDEEANVKEDVLKKRQEAKKKREEELSKLSPEARRAIEEKERKKEERRIRTKNAKKGRVIF